MRPPIRRNVAARHLALSVYRLARGPSTVSSRSYSSAGLCSLRAGCRFVVLAMLVLAQIAVAQDEPEPTDLSLADRPISDIRIVGSPPEHEQRIMNNVRATVGAPYEAEVVGGDVARIHSLGLFKFVGAEAELAPNGSVIVIYSVTAQPLISEVQVTGNRAVSDQELRGAVALVRGLPRDDYLIEKAKRDIEEIYRGKGYFLTDVDVDVSELEERGILFFRVIEGPRVRVRSIEFEGAENFKARRLRAQVRSRTHLLLIRPGVLNEDVLADDLAKLDVFYKDNGFLDVRVDRRIELSPDNREAKVIFLIDEGRRYTLGHVRTENQLTGDPLEVFSSEEIAALLEIQTGDVYSRDKLRQSLVIVEDAYGRLGRIDVDVRPTELRPGPEPVVDLLLSIDEGEFFKVGTIDIQGNFLTKDKVIRRQVELEPGRPFDSTKLANTTARIRGTGHFNDVRLTVQDPVAERLYRDVLIEVKEKNTGSVNFGLAVGSDAGLFGDLSLNQTNFDVADFPKSFSELWRGRAFRGAGQRFNMAFRPGNDLFQYLVSLTEPHLFETNIAGSISGNYRRFRFDEYTEERLTGSLAFTRRLGELWSVGLRMRGERVELTDINADAPAAYFADAGPDTLTAIGLTLTRTTSATARRFGRGSRFTLAIDRFGAFGGDFDFTKLDLQYTLLVTLDEDVRGRQTSLRLRTSVGYIFDESDRVPTYERFFMGGRTFRGFSFRTISPKGLNLAGVQTDEPVGGLWKFFLGAQVQFPIFQETISAVVFADSGTVTEDVGFDEYRLSVGVGLRITIPALGPVPIALDFGFPILKEDLDDEQIFSFSAELPI